MVRMATSPKEFSSAEFVLRAVMDARTSAKMEARELGLGRAGEETFRMLRALEAHLAVARDAATEIERLRSDPPRALLRARRIIDKPSRSFAM